MPDQYPAAGQAIREQLLTIERTGRSMPVFVAGPDNDRVCPGLIVVHEIFGLNEHIRQVARRFAQYSLRVYAPDLFAGAPGLPANRNDLEAMRKIWSDIPDSQLIADLQAVLALAQRSPDVDAAKIGTIGYCMGGAIAFIFACRTPEIAWVIDYYGRIFYPATSATKPRHPIDYADGLPCPLLGVFAGIDELITSEHIDELEERLKGLGKSFDIEIYPDARHAFFNDERDNYHPQAAEDAWRLTIDFIGRVTGAARSPR